MESIELSGRTVEEIRAQAAEQLGVPEDQLEVEVLEQKRGLLGLFGSAEVTARVTVREAPSDDDGAAPAAEPEPEAPPVAEADAVEGPAEALDDQMARLANQAEQVANEMLELMGVSVTARAVEIGDEEVRVNLSGDDIALVIGKHGDTLDAMQLLVAIIANRVSEANARVVLDAEEYRERRRRALEATALSHAAKAKQTGREVVVRDLKAYERRIVHLALRDDPQVDTYSEGEGRHRNLVVSPAADAEASSDEAVGDVEGDDFEE